MENYQISPQTKPHLWQKFRVELTLGALTAALLQHRPHTLGGPKFAAVALILRERKNGPEVLVIERSVHERDPWSGHLAFPGGRHDPNDASLRHTAERETVEEVGLDLGRHGRLLGSLDHVRARGLHIPELSVVPFVYESISAPPLMLDPREVQNHFWVPLQPIAAGQQNTQIRVERDGKSFVFPGYRVHDRTLWGMSYQMLRSLLLLLEPL